MEQYALSLAIGFQQRPTYLPSFWLAHQATPLPQHLVEQGFDTWHKTTIIWNTSWGLSYWETYDIPTPPKYTSNALKQAFLAKEWNPFNLKREKIDFLRLKEFLKYYCELYLKKP